MIGEPVVILYGPTASGKSGLAIQLAERLRGSVINADSLQVYAELEILTARPSVEAATRVPHRLYGVLTAREPSSAAWWRAQALAEIRRARQAGLVPILTGGTGLYIKALMEGLSPLPGTDQQVRARTTASYAELGGESFRAMLAERDPQTAARLAPGDRQRLIRAWEVVESTGIPLSQWQARPRDPGHDLTFRLIGLIPPRAELYGRIDRRFTEMLERGALDEARAFDALGLPASLPANKALGLPELRRHLKGEIGLDEAAALARQATRNYAKRQLTWFRHQLAPTGASARSHDSHAVFEELSERNLAQIISFIVGTG
ncbi:MAG TPA: tRNA (adenosine(37)-N6)-dimethylallyltransferase MiaA [Alphaproteobacteria bacterium]|nr:tRNA (adenosine(37)-N6)-dimethylallyltransferase MiaA [Alphaproteobacteria bacterium]